MTKTTILLKNNSGCTGQYKYEGEFYNLEPDCTITLKTSPESKTANIEQVYIHENMPEPKITVKTEKSVKTEGDK